MKRAKRAFDLLFGGAGLVLLLPLAVVITLLILLDDGPPIFFLQTRVGRGGRPFRIWKFRTMVARRSSRSVLLTIGMDPRITRVGSWLRRWKLDELPQLINVVRGEMSLVGPRPEVPRYVELYTSEQRRVLDLTPGITDPASIRYRQESELLARAPDPERAYIDRIMPDKLRINLAYAARATVWSDLAVILQTLAPRPAVRAARAARHAGAARKAGRLVR